MAEIANQHLLSPALLSLEKQRFLSWWICCFSLFATMWFRVFWMSASVSNWSCDGGLTLRCLLTLGLMALIFLIFFITVLLRLSLARNQGLRPPYIFYLTGLPSSPTPWLSVSPIPPPCTCGLQDCGWCPLGLPMQEGGNCSLQQGQGCWAWLSGALQSLMLSPLTIPVILLAIVWRALQGG